MSKKAETITIDMQLYKQLQTRKSAYKRFGQLNLDQVKALDYVLKQKDGLVSLRIFLFLIDHMDNYNAVVCSHKVIQEALDMSLSTVNRGVKCLKDNQILEIGKTGTTNVYYLNKEIIWHSWSNNRKYAKFGATVVLSESEQKAETTRYSQITLKDVVEDNDVNYEDETDYNDMDYIEDNDSDDE